MKKYRCSFYNPEKDSYIKWDIERSDMEEAVNRGSEYARLHDLYYRGYENLTVGEVPEGPSRIGIKFKCRDTALKMDSVNYLFIAAESEEAAEKKYYDTYYGKHFWFSPGKIEEDGKNVYGKVIETYYI